MRFESFIAYESLLQLAVTFRACLCQSSAIFRHSWGLSFSILTRFAQRWGSLEPSRGGMLEVIGAVGSRSGLCWRLCCCYVTCSRPCWSTWLLFSLPFDLGRWSFAVDACETQTCTWKVRSDKCKKAGLTVFFVVFVALNTYESLLQWVLKFGARLCFNLRDYANSNGTYPIFHVGALLGALLRLLVEVCWKWVRAVGSRSGLCWRLCCCYVICFAAIWVHLAAFSLLFDLGRWSFCAVRVKHKKTCKNEVRQVKKGGFDSFSLSFFVALSYK